MEAMISCLPARRRPRYEPMRFSSASTEPSQALTRTELQGRRLILRARDELNVREPSDWYKVPQTDIIRIGGLSLLRKHKDSTVKLLRSLYPSHPWEAWKFPKAGQAWWQDSQNQRDFLASVGKEMGFSSLSDYHALTTLQLRKHKGQRLLEMNGGSLLRMLNSVFPAHTWLPWKLRAAPKYWWAKNANQRTFLEWLRGSLGMQMEDLYKLTRAQILDNGGHGGLKFNRGSVSVFVMSAYPTHRWVPWKFSPPPPKLFDNLATRRKFMDWLKTELKFNSLADFYRLKAETMVEMGGGLVLAAYSYRIRDAIKAIYPEHNWEIWRFHKAPAAFWSATKDTSSSAPSAPPAQLKAFLDSIVHAYGFDERNLEDWYSVSPHLLGWNIARVLKPFGGLVPALQTAYPNHRWDLSRFVPHRAAVEDSLKLLVTSLYAGQRVVKSSITISDSRGAPLELDILVDGCVAVEYQGDRHYFDVGTYGEVHLTQARDQTKAALCGYHGYPLAEVPYWWDSHKSSLEATLHSLLSTPRRPPHSDAHPEGNRRRRFTLKAIRQIQR